MDMQKDFLSPDGLFAKSSRGVSGIQGIIPNCRSLLDTARTAGVLVIFIRQCTLPGGGRSDGPAWYAFKTRDKKTVDYALPGSEGAKIIPELEPLPGELTEDKFLPSSFHGTFLGRRFRVLQTKDVLAVWNNQ